MDGTTMGSGTLESAQRSGGVPQHDLPLVLAGSALPVVGAARVYVCGITPYDVTHLGHAATFVWADVLTTVLGSLGADVHTCRNVTDVDDVLLDAARARGRHYDELAVVQEAVFERSMQALRVATPRHRPRSRHHVRGVQQLAAALVAAGAAHEADGTVWFHGADVPASVGLPEAEALALAATYGDEPGDPAKAHPLDVAVWRPSADGEPAWPSPWGWGRPGWHAECAAMALAVHGASLDVLVGGADLAFPHHAFQSAMVRAATGVAPFARSVVHVGTVMVDGEKMAKSTGNLVLVDDLLESCSPPALRLMLLDRPWAASWSWHPGLLDAAEARLESLYAAAARRPSGDGEAAVEAVTARLRDDLDVPGALALAEEQGGEAARHVLGTLRLS
ncbi:class I tRNA ligase family protein [uncultured Nocardioides sp.]|uniref:class I tRNA ligase family protein n=1 Tax=uncultured Nocardioides sp. TaxID=198441 RepID=UPI00261D6576|nr:class I tRNA ligase family protein [uncultured Nocardioides sp.]